MERKYFLVIVHTPHILQGHRKSSKVSWWSHLEVKVLLIFTPHFRIYPNVSPFSTCTRESNVTLHPLRGIEFVKDRFAEIINLIIYPNLTPSKSLFQDFKLLLRFLGIYCTFLPLFDEDRDHCWPALTEYKGHCPHPHGYTNHLYWPFFFLILKGDYEIEWLIEKDILEIFETKLSSTERKLWPRNYWI